jgi:hypothetical protein
MSDYWDVGSFKKTKGGKVMFVRLGSAKQKDGGGFSCWLDAMPTPGESGQYEIQIVPQRERTGSKPAPAKSELDDEIPW